MCVIKRSEGVHTLVRARKYLTTERDKMAALQILGLLLVAAAGCSASSCYSSYYGLSYYCYGDSFCCSESDTCCYYSNYHYYTSTGTIVGSVFGALVFFGIIIGLVCICYRRQGSQGRIMNRSLLTNAAPIAVAVQSTHYPPPEAYPAVVPPPHPVASQSPVMPGQNSAFSHNQNSEYPVGQNYPYPGVQHTTQQPVSGQPAAPSSPDPPPPYSQQQ